MRLVQVSGESAQRGLWDWTRSPGAACPRGRVTLVAGSAGAGKTLLGVNFLAAGVRQYGEPAVLVTFEESAAKVALQRPIARNDLDEFQRSGMLVVLAFPIDTSEIVGGGRI